MADLNKLPGEPDASDSTTRRQLRAAAAQRPVHSERRAFAGIGRRLGQLIDQAFTAIGLTGSQTS